MPEVSTGAGLFILFLIIQRLAELVIARRNTARLMANGAQEFGAGHYPLIVALHSAWIVAIVVFGYAQSIQPVWLVLFALLQLGRLWVLTTLGPRWTTRIIIVDEPLVANGPFRFVRHPNYLVVVLEIFVAPMVLGLWQVALVFSMLNAAMLWLRISVENKALELVGKAD